MIDFGFHDGFENSVILLEKRRLRSIRESLSGFMRVCEVHFHPTEPQPRIAPGKLHRITQNNIWTMWKTELPLLRADLRPNQFPRIWFVHAGVRIVFLCISSHIDNYNDKEIDTLALSRAGDMLS